MPSDILWEVREPTVEGESRDEHHPGTIEVLRCSFGAMQETSLQVGGGLVAGGSSVIPISIAKKFDRSSLDLFKYCFKGTKIGTCRIIYRRPAEDEAGDSSNERLEYQILELRRVAVVSMSWGGSSESAIPDETITLAAESMILRYKEIVNGRPQGAISEGRNFKTGEPVS